MRQVAITTHDNPYDPFDDFVKWYMFDCIEAQAKIGDEIITGLNTCSYLARLANTSDQLSDYENSLEIERAIDDMIRLNPGLYKKVIRETNV